MTHQREHDRADFQLEVWVRGPEDDHFLFEHSRNISEGGIFIATREPLPVGAPVVVRFQPEGADEIRAEGKVVWRNPWRENGPNPNPGMGVRWDALAESDRMVVANIVRTIAILDVA